MVWVGIMAPTESLPVLIFSVGAIVGEEVQDSIVLVVECVYSVIRLSNYFDLWDLVRVSEIWGGIGPYRTDARG